MSFDDFMRLEPDQQVEYLKSTKSYHERSLIGIPPNWSIIWSNPGIINHFLNDCKFFYSLVKSMPLNKVIESETYDEIIFENGQGLMLTDTGKDEPGTTPSCTGSAYAQFLMRQVGIDVQTASYHYVTRPYLTRHGKGFINQECDKAHLSDFILEDRTNHYNDNQGEFRYGKLDIDDLYYRVMHDSHRINRSNLPIIEITYCDEMDLTREFKSRFEVIKTYDTPMIK
jgi:hypothetical protein